MKRTFLLIISVFCCYMASASQLFASEYSQPGFYQVEHYHLSNGLQVVIKPRHNARNVSIQLIVDIGHMNFPCGKRETAHFLEHLLFTGTDDHSEAELHDVIESHGGSWNAETGQDYTLYYIDIYSKHLDVALSTLDEIITRSTITPENVEKSRKIIYRESGGKPSALRSWLFENDVIVDASGLALNLIFPGIEYQCKTLDNAASISREEVLNAYKNYYVAGNMTLVLVGDIESDKARLLIEKTLGTMPGVPADGIQRQPLPGPFKPVTNIAEGRWQPIVGSEASVHLLYRTSGIYSSDYYALTVMESYFQTELYNHLRIEEGMAYDPTAYMYSHDDYGAFVLETDSEMEDVDRNIQLIKATIAQFKEGKLNQARLDNVKRKILLGVARGYESNSSFANYYAMNSQELNRYGKYENYEDSIEKVSLQDIQNATRSYFNDDNLVVTIVKPTFNYTQFYLLILAGIVLLSFVGWRMVKRVMKRR